MEEEISPLEYARSNMLSTDYMADRSGLLELERLCFQEKQHPNISDDSHLPNFDFGPETKAEERLNISKEATMLIQSIKRVDILKPDSNLYELILAGEKRVAKYLRLELPLLHSDHEIDCKNFGQKYDLEIKAENVMLPLEILDENKNQGLTWSPELLSLSSKLIEKLKLEKLCVSKSTLSYLQEILKGDLWTEEDANSMWNSIHSYKKKSIRDPMTPPLSPVESPPQLYLPSSSDPSYQIPVLSDPCSPTKEELEELESGIFLRDVPTPTRDSQNNLSVYHKKQALDDSNDVIESKIYLPFKSIDNLCCSFDGEVPRTKEDSFKIEETLTPEGPASEFPNSSDLNDIVEELKSNVKFRLGSPDLDNKLTDNIFPQAYDSAIQKVEQEELIEVDASLRVAVPKIDFSNEEPEWKIFEKTTKDQSKLLNMQKKLMKKYVGSYFTSWFDSANVDLNLRWNPFSQDFKDDIIEKENFNVDDPSLKKFLPSENYTETMDRSNSVRKSPVLKFLKEDECIEDENELYRSTEDISLSITSIAKKRKVQIEEQKNESSNRIEDCETDDQLSKNQTQSTDSRINDESKLSANFGFLSSQAFSACNAVDSFLKIRGTKKQILKKSPYFDIPHSQSIEPPDLNRQNILPDQPSERLKQATLPSFPSCEGQSISIVVASTLLSRRLLIKTIQKLLPKLNLVERDYSIHNNIAWMQRSVTRSPIISPLAYEADVIISPTTGVILTTFQKVKQKPLPGQKNHSSIRALLISVSIRYENIIVLVSEGRDDECTIGPDNRDCLAFSEFISFTISLDSIVIVRFIGGGEETLAHWLVSFIVRNSVEGLALKQDETHWEVFFRRAGFNTYASQVVINNLKILNALDEASRDIKIPFGIMGFVGLNARQRMYLFGNLVGKRVIERVSEVIDSPWTI